MNPTAVIFFIVLSLAAVSFARIQPPSGVYRRDAVVIPAGQIGRALRLPTDRHVRRERCHVSKQRALSREEFEMTVRSLANGEVGFRVQHETSGFQPGKDAGGGFVKRVPKSLNRPAGLFGYRALHA